MQQQNKRKLETEIDNFVMDRSKLNKQISYLEKERDRLVEEQLDMTKKIEDFMDDFKLKKVFGESSKIFAVQINNFCRPKSTT